jgi:hypothetical protein
MTKRFRLLKWGGVCGEASSDAETYGPSKTVVKHQLPTKLINSLFFNTKYLRKLFADASYFKKLKLNSTHKIMIKCKCLF